MIRSYPKWLEKKNTTIVIVIFVPETGGSSFLGDYKTTARENLNLPPSRKNPKQESHLVQQPTLAMANPMSIFSFSLITTPMAESP